MSKIKKEVQNIYPLSPMQNGMLLYSIMEKERNTYFRQAGTQFTGNFDIDIFRKSFDMLIKRYDILRTVFVYQKVNEPLQVVLKEQEADIYYKDISFLDEERQQSFIEEFSKRDEERGFDISKDMLFRISVFKTSWNCHKVIWSFNHILMDGWCLGILLKDMLCIYKSLKNNECLELDRVFPYSSYINWLQKQDKEQVYKYWEGVLEGLNQSVSVPKTRGIEVLGEYRREKYSFEFDYETTKALESSAKASQVTMNTFFQAIWGVLLYKYNNTDDIVFGTVVSGRPVDLEGSGSMLGLFINTIPMRMKLDSEKPFNELLREVQDAYLDSERFSYAPLNEIQALSPLKQDLINHLLVFENYPLGDEITRLNKNGNLGFSLDGFEIEERTNYDFNIIASYDGRLKVDLVYNATGYDKDFIMRIEGHFKSIARNVLMDPKVAIKDIGILTSEEENLILNVFNNTHAEYFKDKTLNMIFAEQVKRTPENTAVISCDKTLTYRELDQKSSKVAAMLKQKGLGRGGIVAVMMERSLEMVISIYGILKASGAYLPVSPAYPEERIGFMLQDSGAKILLTKKGSNCKTDFGIEILEIESESFECEESFVIEDITRSDDLAYVIYTSGSTGKPKGVMIEHYSAVNRLNWMQKEYQLGERDLILQKTPFTFDVSVWELFWWSFCGAAVCMLEPDGEKNPEVIVNTIEKYGITTMHFVPSMLNTFIEYIKNPLILRRLTTLRQVFASGEALNLYQIDRFNNSLNKAFNTRLHNLYGPTEATVDVSYFPCSDRNKLEVVPIGKPIDNIFLYVLNKDGGLQPVGISGELHISGDGLARGYLNRPELTEEKFISNPFRHGERMYKTGDLARWMPDGNVEYLGRLDHQVKIRGFRIEIGEIEENLSKYPGIRENVVVPGEDPNGNKYLCGYIVSKEKLDIEEVRTFLLKKLPDYMIPAYILQIERLPLSQNGKVDRKALLNPLENVCSEAEYFPPRNEIEEKLAKVWKAVLGIERVGINDNFSSLGGDSIKAIQVVGRLYKENLKLELKDLFQYSTIAKISSHVASTLKNISQEVITGEVKLTPIQSWFFKKELIDKHHFNQSVLLRMKLRLTESVLKAAFNKLTEHHDALRMVYRIDGRKVTQFNKGISGELYGVEIHDLSHFVDYRDYIEKKAEELQRSISLEEGPLIKLALFKTYDADYLLIIIHHLAIDGVSWRILLNDFVDCYNAAAEGKEIQLPQKTDSYKDWADQLYVYANSSSLLKEIEFWKTIENSSISFLPKDGILLSNTIRDSKVMEVSISSEATTKLLKSVNNAYNTEINDILLAALSKAVKEWSALDKTVICLEGHGRESFDNHIDLTRTVGWFTSLYPLILDTKWSEDISCHIRCIKECIRRIPNKGIGYGIIKYLTSPENKEDIGFKLNPEICFNYLGEFGIDMETEMFSLSDIPYGSPVSPDMVRPYKFDINGMIIGGKLTFTFNYNKYEYNEATVRNFVMSFKNSLEEIIEHCSCIAATIPTPSDFGDVSLPMEDFEYIMKQTGGEIQNIYPLSPMQEGILFHSIMDNSSNTYFEQASIGIEGDLDIVLLEKCFRKMVDAYDILRTVFIYDKVQTMRQVVLKEAEVSILFEDISSLNEEEQKTFLEEFKTKDRNKGFHLSKASLTRLAVFKKGNESYDIVWSYHHIIMDGWCMATIFSNLLKAYVRFKRFNNIVIEKPVPYSNFIKWLQIQDIKAASRYWRNYLEDYETQAFLPGRRTVSEKTGNAREEVSFSFDKDIVKGLLCLANEYNVTMNIVFQALWGILLQRYNNSGDVVFGVVVSGRPPELEGIENMLGLFINTLPVRVRGEQKTFANLLREIQTLMLESQKFDYYSLAEIQSESFLKQALIDHIIIFENYPVEKELTANEGYDGSGLKIKSVDVFEQTNYDFDVVVLPGEVFEIKFRFNSLIYDKEIVKSVCGHLETAARAVIKNPEVQVGKIDILKLEERVLILESFNDTAVAYEKDKTIHSLFEEQVEKSPESIALVFDGKQLTYRSLNSRANILAKVLREMGVGPDRIVGLMVERSMDMIVGILAVLKAGGAYLPIDPEYPEDRVKYVLEDSGSGILLTQGRLKCVPEFSGQVIDISNENIYIGDGQNLNNVNSSHDLAYVIYTSGSTGKPKGVMIQHMSVNNFIKGITGKIEFRYGSTILALTTISFDIFVLETLLPLAKGLRVVIASEIQQSDAQELSKLISENGVKMMQATPSRLQLLINEDNHATCLEQLEVMMIGGEALPDILLEKVKKLTKAKVYNMYGPTETTVWSAVKDLTGKEGVSLGRPIANTQIYIVDRNNNLLPPGVGGELCIAGDGLARGYYNRPEFTREKFVQNPFKEGALMYRTGDLAQWLKDGEIEFLGRLDYQVKIRGYRIEIGEIESKLLSFDSVKEAVVVVREEASGIKYLCAYIVTKDKVAPKELREYLAGSLSEYMIPNYFIELEQMPLTPNGKIDRKSLPDHGEHITSGKDFIEAGNDVECKLVEIWKDILKTDKVSMEDNFFMIGGHSLRASVMISRVHKIFNTRIPLKTVFEIPTVRKLAEYIQKSGKERFSSIERVEERDYYPVSSAQKRMLIVEQYGGVGTSYNMPITCIIEGAVDRKRLENAFKRLIERHESLRTSFEVKEGLPVQRVHKEVYFEMTYDKGKEEEIDNLIDSFIRPFELDKAPLMRVGMVSFSAKKHLIIIDVHHIAGDGTSLTLMVNELIDIYRGRRLPELKIQYKDFVEWQNRFLESDNIKETEKYWLNKFSGDLPVLNIPTDFERPQIKSYEGDNIDFILSAELTGRMKKLADEAGVTMYMLLLAAFNVLLAKYSGQEDIIVGSGIAGRQHADIENVMGMFVNSLAMRNKPEGNKTFLQFLGEVKENALKAYENQDYQFEKLVEKLKLKRDFSRQPMFDVALIMENMGFPSFQFEDLCFIPYPRQWKTSKLDITLFVMEEKDIIKCTIEYRTSLFKRQSINEMIGCLTKIIESVMANVNIRISEIELLEQMKKNRVVSEIKKVQNLFQSLDEEDFNEIF